MNIIHKYEKKLFVMDVSLSQFVLLMFLPPVIGVNNHRWPMQEDCALKLCTDWSIRGAVRFGDEGTLLF